MTIKFQIFVSSTYEDLPPEREMVIKAILEMGHIPVGMEMFSAADEEQWKIIARQIDEVDYYIVIIAHQYGSVTDEGVSFTEKEYDYALKNDVPVLGFVIDDSAPWPSDRMEDDTTKRVSLESFKDKVKSKMVSFWSSAEELHAKVSVALMKAINTNPRTGWVRANEAVGPDVIKELTRLSRENAKLRTNLDMLKRNMQEEEDKKLYDIVRILKKNKTDVYIWEAGANDWGDVKEGTLYSIFLAISPNLMVENDRLSIAKDIAFDFVGTSYRLHISPVPSNYLSLWLSDLSSLELIQPSEKKHSLRDTKEYWNLSEFGKQVHQLLRKMMLQLGTELSEKPEDEDES